MFVVALFLGFSIALLLVVPFLYMTGRGRRPAGGRTGAPTRGHARTAFRSQQERFRSMALRAISNKLCNVILYV
jgi:hypothetical protein